MVYMGCVAFIEILIVIAIFNAMQCSYKSDKLYWSVGGQALQMLLYAIL